MNEDTIFREIVEFFARSELSPRINEEKNEIYVNAPLGKIYEKADIFVRFARDYYTVEAYIKTAGRNEGKVLRLLNLINLSMDNCTVALDEDRIVCRCTQYIEGATDPLVRQSIYQPMYTLNLFSPAFKAVSENGKDHAEEFEKIMVQQ